MAAMFRRPRPGGGGHPPPLAPSVSSFKPRAQWNDSGTSSIFLYVNLPGFYIDQIKINKDERTRSIQIQGERRLSSHTKARFSEVYRVPETCDISKLTTSFSHGLLTIEFPRVVEGEKQDRVVQDQGKNVERPNQEKVSPLKAKEQEPKTYKSVLEGKRTVPTGSSQEKVEQKMKEGEASPSLASDQRVRDGKKIERKEDAKMSQQKTVQKKMEEEKARNTTATGGSLNPKVRAKEEKVIERTDKGQKVKEIIRTPTIDGRLDPTIHAKAEKVVESKGDGEIGQKLREEAKTGPGQRKIEKHTKPVVEDEARRREREIAAKNRAEKIARDVNGNGKSKNDKKMVEDKVSGGKTQERVNEKKVEEAGLVKETRDVKDSPEVAESEKVDSDPMMEELTRRDEDRMRTVKESLGSETGPLQAREGQEKTDMNAAADRKTGTNEEEGQKYDKSLVNVGVAAFVIMGFGAYAFVPLVKWFIK